MEKQPTNTHKLYEMYLRDRDMLPVVAIGSAGTGKTFGAVKAAVEWLAKSNGNKVILSSPVRDDELGFLPGTEREKIAPWVRPLVQNFVFNGISEAALECKEKHGNVQFIPFQFIQGLTFDNSMIIIDECQNLTFQQLKCILTRQGKYSKTVLCGDIAQTSPNMQNSGLGQLVDMIDALDLDCYVIEFTHSDILRSERCAKWIRAFEKWEGQ